MLLFFNVKIIQWREQSTQLFSVFARVLSHGSPAALATELY